MNTLRPAQLTSHSTKRCRALECGEAMSVCSIGARCHVGGKGITTFGRKFTQAKALELASSCVLIIDVGASPPLQVASGVLIAPNVVLCANHSLSGATANLQGQLFFECDAKTAPGLPPPRPPPPCTLLSTATQMKFGNVLETGSSFGLDYALVAISWLSSTVTFPRQVTLPKPDYYYGGELLGIGHPVSSYKAEPTQATAGNVIAGAAQGPHHDPVSPAEADAKEYTYTNISFTDGMSGGGVFNENGRLVGIIEGMRKFGKENSFLNIGLVASK